MFLHVLIHHISFTSVAIITQLKGFLVSCKNRERTKRKEVFMTIT